MTAGRRMLNFGSFDEIMPDVERLLCQMAWQRRRACRRSRSSCLVLRSRAGRCNYSRIDKTFQ